MAKNFSKQLFVFLFFSALELGFQITRALQNAPAHILKSFLQLPANAIFDYFLFGIQFLLLICVLSALSEILRHLLNIKNSWLFASLMCLLSFFSSVAVRPHFLSTSISQHTIISFSVLGLFVFFCIFCLGFYNKTKMHSKLNRLNYLMGLVLIAAIIIANQPTISIIDEYLFKDVHAVYNSKPRDSVLIVSVDSLRPDFIIRYVKENPDSRFSDLIKKSAVFTKMITPIARTHPSLVSFLTGLNPPDHNVRENLMPENYKTEKILSNSNLLKDMLGKDIQTRFIIDENKFAQFNVNKFIKSVVSPKASIVNHILSLVFKSTLYNTFFNNFIGYKILSQANDNAAFSATYNPKSFLKNIIYEINNLDQSRPFFLLAHTCSMHYPGHSRAKYIQKYQSDKKNLSTEYTNYYSTESNKSALMPDNFKDLAYGNFNLIVDDVIAPLLKILDNNSSLKDINLVFMSDHGETFWTEGASYSSTYMPSHGGAALLNEDSYESVFLVYSKKVTPGNMTERQSLIDMNSLVADLLFKNEISYKAKIEQGKYYESGVWAKSNFKSQLLFLSRNLEKLYQLDDAGNVILLEKSIVPLKVQKSRAVFYQNNHYTLFPTNFGIEAVFCKEKTCTKTIKNNEKFIDEINNFTIADIKDGIWPRLLNERSQSGDFLIDSKSQKAVSTNAYTEWLVAQHNLNNLASVDNSISTWSSILRNKDNELSIRKKAYSSLLKFCTIYSKLNILCADYNDLLAENRIDLDPSEPARFDFFIMNLINSSRIDELKKYSILEKKYFLSQGFYLKFWQKYLSLPDRFSPEDKILEVKLYFNDYIKLGFFEIDRDWISFLKDLDNIIKSDRFTSESIEFLKDGRLPFVFVINDILPRIFDIYDLDCYTKKIVPTIFAKKNKWMNTKNWSVQIYNITNQSKYMCRISN